MLKNVKLANNSVHVMNKGFSRVSKIYFGHGILNRSKNSVILTKGIVITYISRIKHRLGT